MGKTKEGGRRYAREYEKIELIKGRGTYIG